VWDLDMTRLVFAFLLFWTNQPSVYAAPSLKLDCRDTAVILPPHVFDPLISANLAKYVIEKQTVEIAKRSSRSDCQPFFDYDKGAAEWDRLGFTSNFQTDVQAMRSRQLLFLWERTAATHVVQIEVDTSLLNKSVPKGGSIPIFVYVYRLSDDHDALSLLERIKLSVALNKITEHKLTDTARILSRMTPNSINFSPGVTIVEPEFSHRDPNYKYEIHNLRNHGVIPPVLSAIRISRVEHPDAYRMFDYEVSLFPSTTFLFINQDVELRQVRRETDDILVSFEENHNVTLKYTAGCTHVAGQLSLFSILGTTYLSVGVGPCFIHNESRGRYKINYFDTSTLVVLGHRVFFNEQFFFDVYSDSVTFGKKIYKDDVSTLETSRRSYASFGYYVDDAERMFARAWRAVF